MDKDYLKLLKTNTELKKEISNCKFGAKISLSLNIVAAIVIICMTVMILNIATDYQNYKENSFTELPDIVSAPINIEVIEDNIDQIIEKDNEIAQLKDRITFLSFFQAMYEEDEGIGFDPVTTHEEYVALFTIGQKVPLPTGIDTNTFRCMDYRTITDTTSWQYKIQGISYTDPNSGLRYYEYNGSKYYTVALATAYGIDIGNAYKVELENGTTFNIIHAEYKHDIRYPRPDDYGDKDKNYDGEDTISVIEFVYDWMAAPAGLIGDGEANRWLGEGCDIYGNGCNIKSMTYLGKIWSVN